MTDAPEGRGAEASSGVAGGPFGTVLAGYLERARDFGALGPGAVGEHVRHATAWAAVLGEAVAGDGGAGLGAVPDEGGAPGMSHDAGVPGHVGGFAGKFLDLGTGAGIPGLVLALRWPDSSALLLDSRARRVRMLAEAIPELGLERRVEAAARRAEMEAREPSRRGAFDLVVARGFGPPAATAECAAGFLSPSGRLSVSEPPGDDPERWPPDLLRELGFGPASRVVHEGASFVILQREGDVSDRWPRRDGLPHKRPLW